MCDKIITLSTWQNLFENPEWSGGGVGNELKKVAVRMDWKNNKYLYNNNFSDVPRVGFIIWSYSSFFNTFWLVISVP